MTKLDFLSELVALKFKIPEIENFAYQRTLYDMLDLATKFIHQDITSEKENTCGRQTYVRGVDDYGDK